MHIRIIELPDGRVRAQAVTHGAHAKEERTHEVTVGSAGTPQIAEVFCEVCGGAKVVAAPTQEDPDHTLPCTDCPDPPPEITRSSSPTLRYLIRTALTKFAESEQAIGFVEAGLIKDRTRTETP